MARKKLDLKNQGQKVPAIEKKWDDLVPLMEARKEMWQEIPVQNKANWMESGKDPVLILARKMYDYLHDNFFGGKHGYDKGI